MDSGVISAALYVIACLLIPFAWGVLVHWIFQKIEGATARRKEEPAPARPSGPERASGMWDYQI